MACWKQLILYRPCPHAFCVDNMQGLSTAMHDPSADQSSKSQSQALPAKPKPPTRQPQKQFNPQLHATMASSRALPQASGPFPGLHKPLLGSDTAQADCTQEPACDVAILAQHAFGRAQPDVAPLASGKRPQYLPPDARPSHPAFSGSNTVMSRQTAVPTSKMQVSNQVDANSCGVETAHYTNENKIDSSEPVVAQYVTPMPIVQPSPLTESTSAVNARKQGAYVSFDEWQAQVKARQLAQQMDAHLQ